LKNLNKRYPEGEDPNEILKKAKENIKMPQFSKEENLLFKRTFFNFMMSNSKNNKRRNK